MKRPMLLEFEEDARGDAARGGLRHRLRPCKTEELAAAAERLAAATPQEQQRSGERPPLGARALDRHRLANDSWRSSRTHVHARDFDGQQPHGRGTPTGWAAGPRGPAAQPGPAVCGTLARSSRRLRRRSAWKTTTPHDMVPGSPRSPATSRWWLGARLVVLGIIVGAVVTLAQPKEYTATASVFIGEHKHPRATQWASASAPTSPEPPCCAAAGQVEPCTRSSTAGRAPACRTSPRAGCAGDHRETPSSTIKNHHLRRQHRHRGGARHRSTSARRPPPMAASRMYLSRAHRQRRRREDRGAGRAVGRGQEVATRSPWPAAPRRRSRSPTSPRAAVPRARRPRRRWPTRRSSRPPPRSRSR